MRVRSSGVTVLIVILSVGLLASAAKSDIIYQTFFEGPGSLGGWHMLQRGGYGFVPGVTPCGIGENVLWMHYGGNQYCTAYYTEGTAWTDYCVSVWGKATSNVMPYINVFFRIQEVGGPWYGINNGYNIHIRHSQNNIELQRVVDGFGHPLATVPYDFVAGTWYAVKVRAGSLLDPDSINVYINTVCTDGYIHMIGVTDTAYSAGSIAIGCLSSGGDGAVHDGWFDHVKVTTLDHSMGPSATEGSTWGTIKALYR